MLTLQIQYNAERKEFKTDDDFICAGTLKAWIINHNPNAPLDAHNLHLSLKARTEGAPPLIINSDANSESIDVGSYESVTFSSLQSILPPQPLPPGSKAISIILNAHNAPRVEIFYVSADTTIGELKTSIRHEFRLPANSELELLSSSSIFRNKQDTDLLGERFIRQLARCPEALLTARIPEQQIASTLSEHPYYTPPLTSCLIAGGTIGAIVGTVAGTAIAGGLGYLAQGASQESLAIVFGTTIPGSFLLGLAAGGIAFAKASANTRSPA